MKEKAIQCSKCSDAFEFAQEDQHFLELLAPSLAGNRLSLPLPTKCPECRKQQKVLFRNDQHYYRNHCSICSKDTISIYSPDKKFPIACPDCFWGDAFDAMQYGADYDLSRSFTEQFSELKSRTPRLAIFNTRSENSRYTVHSASNKDCYMCSSAVGSERVQYSDFVIDCINSQDCLYGVKLENCYEAISCEQCYSSDYIEMCLNISDSFLCFDCRSGDALVGCVGLRRKSSCILNKPASKSECRDLIVKLKKDPQFFKEFSVEFEKLCALHPRPAFWSINSENVSGDYIKNCKNAHQCFIANIAEDLRYTYESTGCTNCFDGVRCARSEMLYCCTATVELFNSAFCNLCYQSDHLLYCDNCQSGCSNCFACFALKRAKYCILNKQYSKKEYENLLPKIIDSMLKSGEWGQFFSSSLSPFGYNETKAMEWYPLIKEEAIAQGFNWSDFENEESKSLKSISRAEIPDDISMVTGDTLKNPILCELSSKPFRVLVQDLDFYKSKDLSIPRLSPLERHQKRVRRQNRQTLHKRFCEKCGTGISTTSDPSKPYPVYCIGCYEHAVA